MSKSRWPSWAPLALMVSVDVMQHCTVASQSSELYESRGGRPGLPVPNTVIVRTVSVKQHCTVASQRSGAV